ncbi:hypothetical protein [Thermomonospora umbrina]|uniref:Uncharacterized protein n=1 Tax=Thermomonospora umbrina TaxID=111806 RepID=A0A3D9SR43_9ACTN|nr:hypothetical protein [Thermomonospora umbrina]REE98409.1 hypothetical protein DFJ69_3897 [Thermomonospora umbrina]
MTQDLAGLPAAKGVGARWSTARRAAGHGAALSMSLYLSVKVVWVVMALFGDAPDGFGTADWMALNAVTVVMAVTGVALGLALARPWGRRLRPEPVLFFSWVGAGFLVPMLPYAMLSGVLGAVGVGSGGDGGDGADEPSLMPQWETAFLTIGFAGMAVGLAVAVPIYLRERWPRAFLGQVGQGRLRSSKPIKAAMAVALALGLLWSSWALGATLGFDPARRDHLDLNGRLLSGSSGVWALLGAWSVWVLTRRRPAGLPLWIPLTLAFGASGSLFAWSAWKLPMVILRPGGFETAEYLALAIVEHTLAIGVGLTLMSAVLRAARGTAGAASTAHLQ